MFVIVNLKNYNSFSDGTTKNFPNNTLQPHPNLRIPDNTHLVSLKMLIDTVLFLPKSDSLAQKLFMLHSLYKKSHNNT